MNRTLFLLFLSLFSVVFNKCLGQTLVNSTGGTLQDNNYIIEYSIGEIGITTIEDPSANKQYYITQGLLQPPNAKLNNPDCSIINDTLEYFPNPTRNILALVSRDNWITSYVIFAADGKLVRVSPFYNNQIDLSNLAAATYFIKLYPGCNNKFRVLKVIKL